MRLTKIKLAGFKTFVDPTSLQFPSNLTGIIGPNGCGKSNIIDAIRWVMGESSARNLRGDSMEDVIFSGSSTRSEVGKAFVELNFDNSSNTLDSKFARFSEIVIRREVSRDGISNYFLNNTKCRRKDIREVFLGTGLGPRSYAIIEQGMISKLVEAKPDELRTYLEEAAGISKYKEKRRETELRLKHTRENLNRLNDVMKEITSQLNKLERQAKLAKEFKSFKQDERKLKLSLLALKWNNYDQQIDNIEVQIRKVEINHEKEKSVLSSKNKKIEELRESRNNEQSRFDKIQKDFYKLGSDIASCEKDIEHSQETETTRKEELDELSKKAVIAQKDLEMEAKKNVQVLENIEEIKEKNKSVSENLKNLEKNKKDVNFAMQNLLSKINTFIGTQSENIKKQEVEKTKLEASDKSLSLLSKRLKILESYTINETDKNLNKDELLRKGTDVQEKLASLQIDFERSDVASRDKFILQSSQSLKSIVSLFRELFKSVKILVRSQNDEIKDINKKIKDYEKIKLEAQNNIKELDIQLEEDITTRTKLDKERIELKQLIDKVEWNLEETVKSQNDLNIKITSLESEKDLIKNNINKFEIEISDLNNRKLHLLSSDTSKDLPSDDMKIQLKKLLELKSQSEDNLTKSREAIQSYDNEILEIESQKNDINILISSIKDNLEDLKISISEKTAQRDALIENTDLPKKDIDAEIKSIDMGVKQDILAKDLQKVQSKINSMGAINLAAIDELEDQQERKQYLDSQYNDLTESVKTLDNAIKKIDSETKSKFKEIFDSINSNLNTFFNQLFGGGKAYLELTDNDLLNTGVTIMARPPGKLVKNINLLSGGEKAGTGIAFVFSIFKSNPAPFCLLDEVDAPLDDANNNRFCNVVKEMSKNVQFIFITHNKLTMELADILSGVTMREAGVSKLVSVNINDAVSIAASKNEDSVSSRPS
tara:strand:+ start:2378 stop:5203 length:2826 start_codon:yes stop_codon:yes gene_type:complete